MEKGTVSLSVLLTLAVSLLGLGMDVIQKGEYATGTVCVIVGFCLILVGVYLFREGIIEEVRGKVEQGKR